MSSCRRDRRTSASTFWLLETFCRSLVDAGGKKKKGKKDGIARCVQYTKGELDFSPSNRKGGGKRDARFLLLRARQVPDIQ